MSQFPAHVILHLVEEGDKWDKVHVLVRVVAFERVDAYTQTDRERERERKRERD